MAGGEPDRYISDKDGRVYVLLGPGDTRTASHYMVGGTAYPIAQSFTPKFHPQEK